MQSSAERGLVIAKLEDGADLFAGIESLAAEHGIEHGMVMWGIGMLRDFELGYFNGKAYERTTIKECMELLALHGSLVTNAEPKLHLHVAAGGPDKRVLGGHLFRGTVCVVNELCLWRLDETRLNRVLNPKSGLRELTIG